MTNDQLANMITAQFSIGLIVTGLIIIALFLLLDRKLNNIISKMEDKK